MLTFLQKVSGWCVGGPVPPGEASVSDGVAGFVVVGVETTPCVVRNH